MSFCGHYQVEEIHIEYQILKIQSNLKSISNTFRIEQPGIIIVCWSTFKNIWLIVKSFNVSFINIKHGCKLYDVIELHDSSNHAFKWIKMYESVKKSLKTYLKV